MAEGQFNLFINAVVGVIGASEIFACRLLREETIPSLAHKALLVWSDKANIIKLI